MKPIQLRKKTIDIKFNDENGNEALVLYFDKGDENIKRIMNFDDEFEEIKKEFKGKEKDFDAQKDFLEKIYDTILQPGSFKKMQEFDSCFVNLLPYLLEIAIGIKEELEAEDLKALENKYLK